MVVRAPAQILRVLCTEPTTCCRIPWLARRKSAIVTVSSKKDLDVSNARVHLHEVMLIVRPNERKATRAVFTAGCDRLFGGQHRKQDCGKDTLWTVARSIPSRYSSQGLEPSIWRGS